MYKGSDKHKEAIRAWAKAHPEKRKAIQAKSYAKRKDIEAVKNATNPDRRAKRLAAVRKWQAANPEKLIAYRKSESRKLTVKVHGHKRRVSKGAGDFNRAQWLSVVASFNSRCAYCLQFSDRLTLDHFRPLSEGGEHTEDNIVPACPSCNYKKNRSLLFDFLPRGVGVTAPKANTANV